MSGLLKAKAEYLEGARMSLKESVVLSEISKAKAKEESPDGMAIRAASDPSSSTSALSVIAEVSPIATSSHIGTFNDVTTALRRVRGGASRIQLARFRRPPGLRSQIVPVRTQSP